MSGMDWPPQVFNSVVVLTDRDGPFVDAATSRETPLQSMLKGRCYRTRDGRTLTVSHEIVWPYNAKPQVKGW